MRCADAAVASAVATTSTRCPSSSAAATSSFRSGLDREAKTTRPVAARAPTATPTPGAEDPRESHRRDDRRADQDQDHRIAHEREAGHPLGIRGGQMRAHARVPTLVAGWRSGRSPCPVHRIARAGCPSRPTQSARSGPPPPTRSARRRSGSSRTRSARPTRSTMTTRPRSRPASETWWRRRCSASSTAPGRWARRSSTRMSASTSPRCCTARRSSSGTSRSATAT